MNDLTPTSQPDPEKVSLAQMLMEASNREMQLRVALLNANTEIAKLKAVPERTPDAT